LENCKAEIEQIKMDMAHYEKKQAAKKAENEEKFKLLKYAHINNFNLLIKIYSLSELKPRLCRASVESAGIMSIVMELA
jgi:hypothetical protein